MRIFVYGGCATRDAAELYPEYGLELGGYIARQSLISAYSPASIDEFDFRRVTSSFKKRMYMGDVQGNLISKLEGSSDQYDFILWDLNIERVGYTALPSGGVISGRQSAGMWKGKGRLSERVPFASNEHYRRWCRSVELFMSDLEKIGKERSLIVNATPWAALPKGTNLTSDMLAGQTADWFNAEIQRYHEYIESLGVPVLRIAPGDAVADPEHKWGPAMFHYKEVTYRSQIDQLLRMISV